MFSHQLALFSRIRRCWGIWEKWDDRSGGDAYGWVIPYADDIRQPDYPGSVVATTTGASGVSV
jgi:hypothetical protein